MPTTKKPTRRGDAAIGDDAVRVKTGKGWKEWFAILDRWGAKDKEHKEIAAHLQAKHRLPGWWAQMVTVQYERERGLRAVGQRRTGAYEVNLQRTVATDAKTAFAAFTDPKQLSVWFTTKATGAAKVGGRYSNADGDCGEYRVVVPPKRVRFTWENPKHCPGTIVEATFTPAGKGKVAVRITHFKLDTEKNRDEMREGWSWALDSLKSYLETGEPITHEAWKKARH